MVGGLAGPWATRGERCRAWNPARGPTGRTRVSQLASAASLTAKIKLSTWQFE